jgi:hypothetical protein
MLVTEGEGDSTGLEMASNAPERPRRHVTEE